MQRNNNFNYKDYVKRSAFDNDYKIFFKDNVTLIDQDTEKIVAVYFKLPTKQFKLLLALQRIRYIKDVRTEGLKTQSRIFGYRPRETIRKDFCSSTSLATENQYCHNLVCEFGKELTKHYRHYCEKIFQEHKKITEEKILSDWIIKDTVFTSGIVNKNNPLKYHFDSGNFSNLYSNMVAFKHKVRGGHLVIPEYDLGLEIADCSVLLFDGQKILHGVTPIDYQGRNSYRYSIVYYTLKKMWNCEPLSEEIARVKRVKT